jgi:predicted P-loop ATPase
VLELLRPTLSVTKLADGTTLDATIEKTRKLYDDSMRSRLVADERRAKEDADIAELARRLRGGDVAEGDAAVKPPEPQPLRSGSFLSLVEVLRGGGGLDGETLEFDSMAGRVTIGRRPLKDEDIDRIRCRIQETVVTERDRKGQPMGLMFSASEVHRAVTMVAREREFHPVREHLSELAWDGHPRIDRVVEEILGAEPTALNRLLFRRWIISAVARAMTPGCEAQTVLILIGEQGAGKSRFLRTLSSPWFNDSPVAIGTREAFTTIRRSWIHEWAELDALKRARDVDSVKAFITSPSDRYRPAYGHEEVDVPRSGVIVGTTNRAQFLDDDTGGRRFWPIMVGVVDLKKLASWRDVLWAEAVTAWSSGEQWWLDPAQEAELRTAQTAYEVGDAWGDKILAWIENPIEPGTLGVGKARAAAPITTANILQYALGIEPGRWKRADEMRVAAIMRRAGWRKARPDPSRPRVWQKITTKGPLAIVK